VDRPSTMRRSLLSATSLWTAIACLLAVTGSCSTISAPTSVSASPPSPAATVSPVSVGEFRGDGAQMGRQQAAAFGPEIRQLHDEYLVPQLQSIDAVQARMAAAAFEALMLPEHRAEVIAMAQALGINQYDAVLGQCFEDLTPQAACSTISVPASGSPDGIARFGRNLDMESLGVLQSHSVLLIFHPQGRYSFASIGWPGMIGVVSGMNEYGLSLACMEVPRPARLPTAMPYTLLYRMILERCRTVDEAIDLLNRTPRQTANNLMLMDAAGNRVVVEIQIQSIAVRRGEPSAALISTNHQRGQDRTTAGFCWRYDLLNKTAAPAFGHIDRAAMEKMLGDVAQGNHGEATLQSMIFEPADRVIYLATGSDAPERGFHRIDLKKYFGGSFSAVQ
jgi:Acyl-coenzyme A:6-aminopenicillanic acid acyl-transferase